MTEALKKQSESPLTDLHRRIDAVMGERDGWTVPNSYGNKQAEYAAVRSAGAGLIDLSPRGRILVSGSEAVPFLNGLITNDLKTLAENTWMAAAFPNVQGRLIASVRIARLPDANTFLVDTETATHERVLKTIERFTMAGDFHVRDVTGHTAMVSLQGARAREIAGIALQQDVSTIEPKHMARLTWPAGTDLTDFANGLTMMCATHTGEDGCDFIVNTTHAASLWSALTGAGATPVGFETLETLRIEAGIPRYGVDMDESNIVTEVLFDDAVSYTKGCYLGQEIVARIKYRGHVAKQLTGVVFEKAEGVVVAPVRSADGKEIGRLTSVGFSPQLDRSIALGVLKYDYLAAGTTVKVAVADGEASGQVVELPFVHGSWRN